jgi:hypothetical protein
MHLNCSKFVLATSLTAAAQLLVLSSMSILVLPLHSSCTQLAPSSAPSSAASEAQTALLRSINRIWPVSGADPLLFAPVAPSVPICSCCCAEDERLARAVRVWGSLAATAAGGRGLQGTATTAAITVNLQDS